MSSLGPKTFLIVHGGVLNDFQTRVMGSLRDRSWGRSTKLIEFLLRDNELAGPINVSVFSGADKKS